jgi:hypothetical protein
MADEAETNKELSPEELVKQGQDAAQQAEMKQAAQDAIDFEKDMKAKLRENAKLLNVTLPPNASIPTMVQILSDAKAQILNDLSPEQEAAADAARPPSELETRRQLRLENTKLVRVRISCLNPNKSGLPGEIFTVHNDIVGTVKKFVPYNEAGDSYHVPFMLLKFLKRKKFLQIKDPPKGSRGAPTTKMVPEFALEILEPLTQRELAELAKAQGAAESAEDL